MSTLNINRKKDKQYWSLTQSPLKHLTQGTVRSRTKLFKLWPYKTTDVHSLESHDSGARI